ncbi:MAG TPA: hypothetical protein VK841_16570 [Polyangiaceae bacterium]|jgi:hypothetical protein|nr:hypothetical protein [Polyangiaceae bacterium]
MDSKWIMAAVVSSLLSFAGCGGSGDNNGESAGGCTISESGIPEVCLEWTNLPVSISGSYCPSESAGDETVSAVSSCPTADAVGTCTINETVGSTTYSFYETFYSGAGGDCSSVKEACLGTAVSSGGASITTTFSGGC